ncbi:Membrane protein involved in the export of O-antigen and teichoic acid [Alkalibacterium subtropicum]|uniref:Membrane protein involved in the export of O-antigen and teichoic acid n=1 Tax=Alkalibacterium subtropicum TaxID=753702 RepID=A0A1I1GGC2_9LACT|nr:polysaccharide biosynthesis C-terminal domain-containing protein [Alkalibacterium subtropicum]SFC10604.1 Membrane protein involved in the export of O-antigen and teichoic acid [Alkalibacterium subtropicum]
MKINKKLTSNIYTISVLKKFNVILFGIFSTALLNRYLGPTNKGEYAYILSIANILVVLLNFGINLTYPSFKRRQDKNYLPIFQALSIFEFVFLLFISAISFLLTNDPAIFLIILLTAIGVFRMQLNYFNLVENIHSHSYITIIAAFFNFIFILVIYMLPESNLLFAYIVYILKDSIIIVLSFKSIKRKLVWKDFDFKMWKEIITYGLVPMYTTLLISINYKIDVILLETLNINLLLIGLYTVGVSLAEYGWLVPDIFKDVMINRTAVKDDIDNMTFSLRISSTTMIFVYIGIVTFGEKMILILFGNEFIDAYSVTVIIFLGIYSMIYTKIIGTLYIAKGQWKFYAIVLSLSVISNIFFNLLMIPIWGINGAAYSSIISYSIAGLAFLLDFKREYSLNLLDLIVINKDDLKKITSVLSKK